MALLIQEAAEGTSYVSWVTLPNPQAAAALGHLSPKLYNQNQTLQVGLGFLSHQY